MKPLEFAARSRDRPTGTRTATRPNSRVTKNRPNRETQNLAPRDRWCAPHRGPGV